MRAADEARERKNGKKGNSTARKSIWGPMTHYSPSSEAKTLIKGECRKYPEDALFYLDSLLQDGFTISVSWSDDRNAVRTILRPASDDARKAPALAAYHSSLVVALVALVRAASVDCPGWDEPRMEGTNVDDW